MSSIIDENSYSMSNQITSGSRSSILLSQVAFKRNEAEDDLMSAKCLQTKYNVLTNDNKFCFNTNNTNNEFAHKLNGQIRIGSNATNLLNGNNFETNSDGIPVPKHVLYPRERVLLEWKEPHKIGAGLTNMGNTCFLNSVLQCLTYCAPLVNYLLHTDDHNPNKCNLNFCMLCEMWRHIRQARSHCGDAIKPIGICRRLKSIAKHFQFGRQEDAHEFLRYVIDNMLRSCLNSQNIPNAKLDPLSKETTAINQIFGGYHRSQVLCLQCKAKSNTYDYFMDFMLDIKNVTSLEKALEKFTAPELLQNDDLYKCSRCKRKVLAKKQFTVYRAPNVATFQLKRFDYNRIFGGKITKSIAYPEKLNLRPYMSDTKGSPILYKLNSVLVHLGPTCNSGHYFCYVRNSNNCWYLMDDSRVIQVNQNQVLNQQAYVLFYVRIDTHNDFHRPTPVKNFISQTTPNGIKLSNISSPELAFRNQKLNNFSSNNVNFISAQNMKKGLKSPIDALKPTQQQSDAIKQSQNNNNINIKHKQQTNCQSVKGLVPYATDSSDEDCPKPTNNLNGSLESNCDKTNVNKNIRLSLKEHNSVQIEKSSPKVEKVENIWTKAKPTVSMTSNPNIPNSSPVPKSDPNPNPNPKPKINIQVQHNNTSELTHCAPVAPITLKVKATTSSWHVVETALRSPSIASNSSTNSINSTTEWTVSECLPECNGSQHSKHHKHRNKGQKQNRCPSVGSGNATQVLNTNQKIPQTDETHSQSKPNTTANDNNDVSGVQTNKCLDSHNGSPKKCELKAEKNCVVVPSSLETMVSKSRESYQMYGNHQREHSERRKASSHRSSIDSLSDGKIRNKESERSHSKSESKSRSVSKSSDEKSTTGSHKHEKRKHRKHKSFESDLRKGSDSDEQSITAKSKHKKKKKLKKNKHKRRKSSESESYDSDDNQLQWIERTKETVEEERNTSDNSLNKPEPFEPYVRQWDENVRDLGKKRAFNEVVPQKQNFVDNNNNDALNGLFKSSARGYGDKVNAWNGGPSSLDASLSEEKRYNGSVDDYDDDFDRGKSKKLKTNRNEKSYESNQNPFQKLQTERHGFNGSFNYGNKHHFDRHFKSKHNNHKSYKSYHNR